MANYELLPAQKEFLQVPHDNGLDVCLYQGGYGSGKTFSGSLLGILLCKKYAGIRGLVTAQTFILVRDTTLVSYFEHLDAMGYKKGKHYEYHKQESKIVFNNGSEILFRSAEDPTKLKSLNLGFVEIEEMSDTPESTFNMLLGRLRQAGIPRYRLFGHTNPESSKGWIYKNFVKNPKPNYRLIIAPSTQNIFLPDSYIESMKDAYDEDYYKINVLGQFGDYSKGLVVKGWSDENIKPISYLPELDLHISCDFNYSPNCWILAHKTEDKVFFFDEFCLDMSTENLIKVILDKYPHEGRIIINGDASGDSGKSCSKYTDYALIQNELIKRGYFKEDQNHKTGKTFKFDLRKANGSKNARFYAWNAKVKNAKGERFIYVDPKCKWLIYNCENLKIIEGTSEFDIPSVTKIKQDNNLKFLGHAFDNASYLVNTYWAIKMDYNKHTEPKEPLKSEHNFDHLLKR